MEKKYSDEQVMIWARAMRWRFNPTDKFLNREFYKEQARELKRLERLENPPKRRNKQKQVRKYIPHSQLTPQQRISRNVRARLRVGLKRQKTLKNNKTMEYIGCSKADLQKHLEQLFVKGMSWQNYGKWEIDHVCPLSSFDLSKEKNLYKAMHYSNMQPLWADDNRRKSNKILTS